MDSVKIHFMVSIPTSAGEDSPGTFNPGWKKIFFLFLFSLGLSIFLFLLQGRINIPNADEGYLWYGSLRVLHGEIPIRDFQAYDPGRYYLTALFLLMGGEGIMPFRFALALFQGAGIFFGLLAARKVAANWIDLAVFGAVLSLWSVQRYRVFEYSWIILTLYLVFRLLENPSFKRLFLSGIFIGFSGFMGRNLGLYAFLSFFLVLLYLRHQRRIAPFFRAGLWWIAGIPLGFSPMILMWVLIPSFFRESLHAFDGYLSSASIPIPWPWETLYSGMSPDLYLAYRISGILFIIVPVLYLYSILRAWKNGTQEGSRGNLLLASASVGFFSMQYAFFRADWEHQAASFTPFLFCVLSLFIPSQNSRKTALALLGLSLLSVGEQCYLFDLIQQPGDSYAPYLAGGSLLKVQARKIRFMRSVGKTVEDNLGPDDYFLAAPMLCNLYPLLRRRSATRELFFLLPASEKTQLEEIRDLEDKKVNWVFIGDVSNVGQDRYKLHNTHPLLWKYFMDHFQPMAKGDLTMGFCFFKRTSYESGGKAVLTH